MKEHFAKVGKDDDDDDEDDGEFGVEVCSLDIVAACPKCVKTNAKIVESCRIVFWIDFAIITLVVFCCFVAKMWKTPLKMLKSEGCLGFFLQKSTMR